MNHWQKEGLLPDGCQVEGQKWRNFTLIDLIWIAIVKNLRGFGISIALIQKVKKNFNTTYGECVFAELQFYSALAFFQKRPCEVLVFNHTEGDVGTVAEVATQYEIEETKRNQGGLPLHISITLNGLVQSIFPDKDLRPLYDNWVDLDEKEAEVLSKIKTGDYEEVALSLENGKVVKLKGKSRRNKNKLHELQKEGGDQDLIVKMRNGKISHLEQTKIEKL